MKKTSLSVLIAVGVVALGGGAVLAAGGQSTQDKIDQILVQLRRLTEREMATGQTVTDEFGTYFVGDSAAKIDQAHQEAQAQVDALIARPAASRVMAVNAIRTLENDPTLDVQYQQTVKSTYDNSKMAEIYYADQNQYEVMIATNRVVQFGPRPLEVGVASKEFVTTPEKTEAQLEVIAREFIAKNGSTDLGKLTFEKGSKTDILFFRWVDKSRALQDGMPPFIQVGISVGGEIVSYTDVVQL